MSPHPSPPLPPKTAGALLSRMADRNLAGHALRVCALAAAVAERMGIHEHAGHTIALGGLLHDVGKLAVPAAILGKPGRLTLREWELVRAHPVVGERMLARCPGLEGLGPLVRHSHERFDGNGYPDCRAGAEIPLGARIITACDAWDAMREHRPYQAAVDFEEGIDRLVVDAGHQFDVDVVAALVSHLRESA